MAHRLSEDDSEQVVFFKKIVYYKRLELTENEINKQSEWEKTPE